MKKYSVHEHYGEMIKYKANVKEVDDGESGGSQKCSKRENTINLIKTFGGGTSYKRGDHAKLKFVKDLVQLNC